MLHDELARNEHRLKEDPLVVCIFSFYWDTRTIFLNLLILITILILWSWYTVIYTPLNWLLYL